jgi:CO/xanthine dehydrogenase FAD-binding subunit
MPKVFTKPYSEFRPDEYIRANTREEVVSLLKHYGDGARVVGAGITIHEMAVLGFLSQVKKLIDITGLGLDYVSPEDSWIKVGASTPLRKLGETEPFASKAEYQVVHEAVSTIPIQVSNAATLGGNICSAVPIVSMPPVMMSLGAEVALLGSSGERTLPLDELYEDYLITKMKPDEFVTEVRIPVKKARGSSTYVAEKTVAVDYPTVSVSAAVWEDADGRVAEGRIAVGSVGRIPARLKQAEASLKSAKLDQAAIDKAADSAAKEAEPSGDLRASPEYRRVLVRYLTRRALNTIAGRFGGA